MKKVIAFLSVLAVAGSAMAANVSEYAVANETIEGSGPSGSPWYHNAQGTDGTDGYYSFAVSDYNVTKADFGFTNDVADITSMSITYQQALPSWASDGAIEILLADATPAFADLAADYTNVPSALGSNLTGLQSLGSFTFTQVADGHADTYDITPSGTAESTLITAINAGDDFRLVLAAAESGVAATYAGIESYDYDGPQIPMDAVAVPEPASLCLVLLSGLFLVRRR